MSVALLQGDSNGIKDFIGLALPSAKAKGWDFGAGVQSEAFSGGKCLSFLYPSAIFGGECTKSSWNWHDRLNLPFSVVVSPSVLSGTNGS